MSSIFTKIIEGTVPSYQIFETDDILSFLTISPIQPGHTLIVPKQEINHILDVPSPLYEEVFTAAMPIGKAIQEVTGCKRIGLSVQGFEVAHFHVHVIPMWSPADHNFQNSRPANEEELASMQKKLVEALKKL